MINPAKKRDELAGRLAACTDFARGSISSVCSTCNRAHCICRKTSSGRAYRLTYKDRHQKTRTVYIPREQLARMKTLIANYARVRKLIDQLVEANIRVFREEARF